MAESKPTSAPSTAARPKHRFIVKAQRSLEPKGEMLFYNQYRSRQGLYDLTPKWNGHFGRSDKIFCEVDWPDDASPPTFVQYVRWRKW
jgi:hypothetical protein